MGEGREERRHRLVGHGQDQQLVRALGKVKEGNVGHGDVARQLLAEEAGQVGARLESEGNAQRAAQGFGERLGPAKPFGAVPDGGQRRQVQVSLRQEVDVDLFVVGPAPADVQRPIHQLVGDGDCPQGAQEPFDGLHHVRPA